LINEERLWNSLMTMAEIGATAGGGVGRLALTDLDRQARDLFRQWCEQAGCSIRIDRLGNIFARRAGTDPDAAPVMTGSHLDSQPLGGKFDGAYGVLAGLEVIRALNDEDIKTHAPIDVAVWTDEEGVRFGGGCLASAAFAGLIESETALGTTDADGLSMGDELVRIEYAGDEPVGGIPVAAFFEAHIEQGPVLEAEGIAIGAVLGAQGQRNFEVTVTGDEGHAGTLPMNRRRDAYLGAARMADALNAVAFRFDPVPVVTIGHVRVTPNSRNTIPGTVVFSIDSRHPDDGVLSQVKDAMRAECERVAGESNVEMSFKQISHSPPVVFDGGCVDAVRQAADRLDLASRDIHSGAGHDACNLARCTPTGMIFVPCRDGISHNEKESATPEDLAAGAAVLLEIILERAGRV